MIARGRTWVGRVRSRNEDVYTVRPDLEMIAVADGMGGTPAGHIAARVCIDEISALFEIVREHGSISGPDVARAITVANEVVHTRGHAQDELEGMGTTIVVATVNDMHAIFGHVGDSRGYLLRKRALTQVTKDHSLVQQWVDEGKMDDEEARHSMRRNIVTRSIGIEERVVPEITEQPLRKGDLLMLCSDGISDYVEEAEIEDILVAHGHNLTICINVLFEVATKAGSTDNMTSVMLQVPL